MKVERKELVKALEAAIDMIKEDEKRISQAEAELCLYKAAYKYTEQCLSPQKYTCTPGAGQSDDDGLSVKQRVWLYDQLAILDPSEDMPEDVMDMMADLKLATC